MGKKITELPAGTQVSGQELFPAVQSGTTKKFSLSTVAAWIRSAITPSSIGAQPTITANGILKGDGAGGVSAAVAGTDYQAPLTAGTDYATPAQLADKANPGQIGYPESGTTASRNYTAGEYICWNGLTYTANQSISSGATLSAGTGGNLTECVGGGLNYLSGGLRFAEYPNLSFTFQNSQASDYKTISSIDSKLAFSKAVIAWCTSQGTPIFPYVNAARTNIGVYSPAGSLNGTITVRLIAIY